jgi:hypothetical protein
LGRNRVSGYPCATRRGFGIGQHYMLSKDRCAAVSRDHALDPEGPNILGRRQ